ncbi:TolC family protein [Novipirellula sp.]|uniref:TolC family protein n=1 Tax=Novipirellula sp. TaxID=2795430 RepID=UPI00356921EA
MKRRFSKSRMLLALALTGSASLASAQRPDPGKTFVPPPPVPEAPYGLSDLDAAGPLFPHEQLVDDAYSMTPPPVVVDGSVVDNAVPQDVQAAGYTLSDFLAIAAQNNPTIRQARLQISGETAKALQAGLYPNPTLMYSGEQIGVDVPGDKDSPGEFQGLIVEQRFVTAGKLRLSREKYMRRAHVTEHLAIAQQFRVCNDVRRLFYQTLAASQVLELRRELLKTAEDGAVTARELYNQGQATRPEVRRSNITLQRARLDVLTAENHYREQFRRLVSLVGVDFTVASVSGSLMPETAPLSYQEALSTLLAESPELMAARAKLAGDRVTLQRERVEWVPDIVARGGSGYNFDAKETVAVAEVAIELPVFDRNQGTIRQAQADLIRQQEEIRRIELDLQQRLATTYQQYLTSLQIATEYNRVIIPEAEMAYEELLESYKDNRVDWPDVLSAQHDLFDARLTQIQQLEMVRSNEVLVRGFMLEGGLQAAQGPTPPGHIDATPKPR